MPSLARRLLVAAVLWLAPHAAPLPPAAAGPFEPKEIAVDRPVVRMFRMRPRVQIPQSRAISFQVREPTDE